jgi:23S rRNA (guanosine2251-2'-O)-methyltransferase
MMNKKVWVFGKNTVLSALTANKRKVFEIQITNNSLLNQIDRRFHTITKLVSEKQFLKNLTIDISHQGISACLEDKSNNKIEDLIGNTIILDNIYDHRNIGSIIRTTVAFGVSNLIVDKKNFSSSSQLMHKTASGSIDQINIFQVSNISNSIMLLKKRNYTIVSFDGNSDHNLFENKEVFLSEKIAFILGSEDKGIRELTKKNSDYVLKIPISNVESLNVSAATSSILTIYNYFIRSKESKKSFKNS